MEGGQAATLAIPGFEFDHALSRLTRPRAMENLESLPIEGLRRGSQRVCCEIVALARMPRGH